MAGAILATPEETQGLDVTVWAGGEFHTQETGVILDGSQSAQLDSALQALYDCASEYEQGDGRTVLEIADALASGLSNGSLCIGSLDGVPEWGAQGASDFNTMLLNFDSRYHNNRTDLANTLAHEMGHVLDGHHASISRHLEMQIDDMARMCFMDGVDGCSSSDRAKRKALQIFRSFNELAGKLGLPTYEPPHCTDGWPQ